VPIERGAALAVAAFAAAALATGGVAARARLALTSPALRAAGTFAASFTCSGAGVSPPLRWTAPPHGTRSFALALRDTSTTPVFVHWTAWGIPPRDRRLGRGARPPREGQNTFGVRGYGGPCPPPGERHRYVFTLYALAKPLTLSAGASPAQFAAALRRVRVVASAQLAGYYRR
jgi:Raf kinase inhibitor-like YbhB/YbcL family protein